MSDEKLGIGKRAIKRTERIGDFDSEIAASKARREQSARTKKVAAQEEDLLAKENDTGEEGSEDEEFDPENAGDDDDSSGDELDEFDDEFEPTEGNVGGSKSKSGSKGKTKPAPSTKVDPERTRLLNLLSVLVDVPKNQLKLFTTDRLQKLWEVQVGEVEAKSSTSVGKTRTKSKALATPKAKRLKASVPMQSSITMVGSPVLALKEGERQTAKVMASPLVEHRKREASLDLSNPGTKRIHLDKRGVISRPVVSPSKKLPAGPINSSNSRPSSAALQASAVLRASSRAPSVALSASLPPSRASSVTRNAPTLARQATKSPLPPIQVLESELEEEEQGLGDGTSEEYRDEDILEDNDDTDMPAPGKKGGRTKRKSKGKKPSNNDQETKRERPATKQFEGVERKIVDRAVECTLFIRAKDDFFPDAELSLLTIHQGWDMVAIYCDQDPDEWPINQDHITVIRSHMSSFCSRGRSRINDAFRHIYKLSITPDNPISKVKERARSLYPTQFHRDPEEESPRAGNYKHPFLPEAVHLTFYTGDKPLGVRFSKELTVVTIPMVALVCTMVEDLLIRYGRDGLYIKEEKGAAKANKQEQDGKSARSAPKDLGAIYHRHAGNLSTFRKSKQEVFDEWMVEFTDSVLAFNGKKPRGEKAQAEAEDGVLDSSAFDDEGTTNHQVKQTQSAPAASPRRIPRPRPRPSQQDGYSSPAREATGVHPGGTRLPSASARAETDEEMDGVESVKPAMKNGRAYQPLSDDMGPTVGGDEEMLDGTGGNLGKKHPKKQLPAVNEDAPNTGELCESPLPPEDRNDEQASVAPDTADGSEFPAKVGASTASGEKQVQSVEQGGKGRKAKGNGLVISKVSGKGKGKGKKGKGKVIEDEEEEEDAGPIDDPPKRVTRRSKPSKGAEDEL